MKLTRMIAVIACMLPLVAGRATAQTRQAAGRVIAAPSLTPAAPTVVRGRPAPSASFSGNRTVLRKTGTYRSVDDGRFRRPNVVAQNNVVQQNNVNINQGKVQNVVNNVTNVTSINNTTINNNTVNNVVNQPLGAVVANNYGNVNGFSRPWQGSYDQVHSHWHGGYWNFAYRPSSWVNTSVVGWGAAPVVQTGYVNPFLTVGPTAFMGGYDYSQALQPGVALNDPASGRVTEEAVRRLDAARDAFRAGQYQRSLELVESAIRLVPDDGVMHELRGMALFALQDYEHAAAVIHPVLAGGPGSDQTLIGSLYPNTDLYIAQLNGLVQYVTRYPDAIGPRFLLAYHLLMTGYAEAAYGQLSEVARRRPNDRVTRDLMQALSQQTAMR